MLGDYGGWPVRHVSKGPVGIAKPTKRQFSYDSRMAEHVFLPQ